MDETPLRFDMPATRTLHDKGDKTVHIKTTNSEKRGLTAVLTIRGDGTKLRPWLIFKGVRDPKINMRGVSVHMQRKGYIDAAVDQSQLLTQVVQWNILVLNDQVNGYLCDFLAHLLFFQHMYMLDLNA